MPFDRKTPYRRRGVWVAAAIGVPALLVTALLVGQALTPSSTAPDDRNVVAADPTPSSVEQSPEESIPPAAPAPDGLPVVDYDPAPGGFPADPNTLDVTPLTEGVHPTTTDRRVRRARRSSARLPRTDASAVSS